MAFKGGSINGRSLASNILQANVSHQANDGPGHCRRHIAGNPALHTERRYFGLRVGAKVAIVETSKPTLARFATPQRA